jgi:ubiquinone/menaquinone biosynthesis C-methylase UbiE/uncharacterized membrane protein YbhN (UPF0104 family)
MLLLASAAAVVVVGLAATALRLTSIPDWPRATRPAFWTAFVVACGLTVASLGLRGLRWVFLLRRAEVRIPIKDAFIGYFAGLSLLFAPLLVGEIAVRGLVQRARGGVPVATTAVVNIWERLFDLAALGFIAGGLSLVSGTASRWGIASLTAVALFAIPLVRRSALRLVVTSATLAARTFGGNAGETHRFDRLARGRSCLVAFCTSVTAWLLPGVGFWLAARALNAPFGLVRAEEAYARSSALGGLVLAPGGVLVAGSELLEALRAAGIPPASAAASVLAIRLATAGLATILGCVFVLIHWRHAAAGELTHFDAIADAYDVQIPEGRRKALVARKTGLMHAVLGESHRGARGLDVGCGQGAYVARMRELGYDVSGIDASTGQVQAAGRNIGDPGLVTSGSAMAIPAENETFDFVYVINVLHHLASVGEQRRAFSELVRVLRPGGLLFVHEINTRNILFRFYMGYVFPSLNCIDEGVERWLLPGSLPMYTDVPVDQIRYFTFLPEFLPEPVVRACAGLERWLERSPLAPYSAHYMAVLRKPA